MKTPSTVAISRSWPWRPLLRAVCLAVTTFIAAPAQAGLIVSVQSVSASAGSTGNTLDVTLTNTGPGTVSVGGFSFEITAASSTINFTSATTGTTIAPYIFTGFSTFGPNIDTGTGQTLGASDVYLIINSGTTLGSGATVGLGHAFFDVSGGASGVISVVLTTFPATSLSDPHARDVPIDTLNNGTITIAGDQPIVPEPASFGQAAFAILAGFCTWRRYRRRV